MSWQERPYSDGSDFEPLSGGGGMRSWFGGMPPAGVAVKRIIIANFAIFILCQLTGGSMGAVYRLLAMRTDEVLHGQVWRLVTFTYMHSQEDLWHILLNMLGLYLLGAPLERHWGTRLFFTFYTLGGIAAVLLYLVITMVGWLSPGAHLVGASGNVFAVMGACAVLFPQFRLLLFLFPVPIRIATMLFLGLFMFNLWSRGANAGGDACHLAGIVFGVAWGYRGQAWTGKWQRWREHARHAGWEDKRREMLQLEEQVDRILEKVRDQGIGALTRREKKMLEEATKRKQAEDRRHGF